MTAARTVFAGGTVFDGTGALSAAELMGLAHELGSLEPGKRADLVVVDGDPLDVGTLTERISRVYQDGRLVHDSSIPALAGAR